MRVVGHNELQKLERTLAQQGNPRKVRTAIGKELRAVVKPVGDQAKQHAREILPHHGGLADMVGSSEMKVTVDTKGTKVSVRLTAKKPGQKGRLQDIDSGRIRHPVFADGTKTRREWRWVNQTVPPGWFTQPAEESGPQVQKSLLSVLDDIQRRLAGKGLG